MDKNNNSCKYQCTGCGSIYDNYFKLPCKFCNSVILKKTSSKPVSFIV